MQQSIEIAARALGLKPSMPGYQIVAGPRPLSPAEDHRKSLLKLMNNFFDFGNGPGMWQWQSALGNANGANSYNDPRRRGFNLLNGTCRVTNCDGFRSAFINLATNVLRIDGVGYQSIGPLSNGGYLTLPGTRVIDRHWVGNVRTERQGFAQVRSFKFSEHHFAVYQGRIYDPTTNMTFAGENEMKWCAYSLETNSTVIKNFNGLRVFRINRVYRSSTVCSTPRYLLEIGSSGGWPTNLLTTSNQLSMGSMAFMRADTSRV